MKIVLIIAIVVITYSICFGIMVGVINNSKLYQKALKTLTGTKKREITGLLLLIAPISLILTILVYIGYGAYCVTDMMMLNIED